MNERERALVSHYDHVLRYWSPLRNYSLDQLAERVGVSVRAPLLDVGCGDGRLAQHVPFDVEGIDVSPRRIECARAEYPDSVWHCADLYEWVAACERQYQTIAVIEVLEHLAEPRAVLDMLRTRLANDGAILGTVPLRLPYKAHLHTYRDINAVQQALQPDAIARLDRSAVCRWGAR